MKFFIGIILSLYLINFSYSSSSRTQENDEKNLFRSQYVENIKKYMNPHINPCDDFHEYACAKWGSYHQSPNVLQPLVVMNSEINQMIQSMLNSNEHTNGLAKQVKIFFDSCMNDQNINQKSLELVGKLVGSLGGWPSAEPNWSEDKFDLISILAKRIKISQPSIINIGVEPSLSDSTRNDLYIIGPVTGLKNRNDYLEKRGVHLQNLNAYRTLILDILKNINILGEKAEKVADDIINFETLLTEFIFPLSLPQSERFSNTNLQKLIENYPTFDWKRYLHEVFGYDVPLTQTVTITVPSLSKLIDVINTTEKKTLANYMAWITIFDLSENYLLSDDFVAAFIKFNNVILGESINARWRTCAHKTKTQLGFIVGSMFIKKINFDSNTKKDVVDITKEIKNQFTEHMENAKWIDDETKNEGFLKINHTILGVGYPDFIENEDQLEEYYYDLEKFEEDKFLDNFIATVRFNTNKEFMKLGKPVDKNEWPNIITEVNAEFQNLNNRILVSAAILTPPVYHKYLPQFLKYAHLGFNIGHELTHGFDSNGKEFDYKGNRRTWWTDKSAKQFDEKAKCFVNQYNKFSLYDLHLSGTITLAENIADNAALHLAYELYDNWRKSATANEIAADKLPNLHISDEKLFFISFAQLMCSSEIKKEAVPNQFSDEHSPAKFRVLGTLQNLPEFSEIFNCPLGSPMNPHNKCELW